MLFTLIGPAAIFGTIACGVETVHSPPSLTRAARAKAVPRGEAPCASALAELLLDQGVDEPLAQLTDELRASDLGALSRLLASHHLVAAIQLGDLPTLRDELAAARPVAVRLDEWCAVAVRLDGPSVVLHREQVEIALPLDRFHAAWARGGRWMLTVGKVAPRRPPTAAR